MMTDNYMFVNLELIKQYRKILEIRNQAVERLLEAKMKYIEAGHNDDFILSMYDKEIEFIRTSVKELGENIN